jgi:hypothetical protein
MNLLAEVRIREIIQGKIMQHSWMLACESPFCSNSHEKVRQESVHSWLCSNTFHAIHSLLFTRHKSAAQAQRKRNNECVALKEKMQCLSNLVKNLQVQSDTGQAVPADFL